MGRINNFFYFIYNLSIKKAIKTIEKEIEQLQEKIENAKNPMTKSYLLLKKIDLLKLIKEEKELDLKKIVEQLEFDIKNEGTT